MGAALKIMTKEEEVLAQEPKFKDGDDGGDIMMPPDKITVHNTVNGWSIKLSFTHEDGSAVEERFCFVEGGEPVENVGFNGALKLIAAAMGRDPESITIVNSGMGLE